MTADYFAATETTWPAAQLQRVGPWMIRDGQGGGKRVSAATCETAWHVKDLAVAETRMTALNQPVLFMIRGGEDELDATLERQGYRVIDPVWIYTIDATALAAETLPKAVAMPSWPPLAIQRELWAEGGIGPARLDVMFRAKEPKTAILGRTNDQPAGSAFVACEDKTAMIHAIEVTPRFRRQGVARNMLRAAAAWSLNQGAAELSLLVTKSNTAANSLYTSLGMRIVGQYHYRIRA